MWVLGVRFMRSWWRNSDMFWSEMADYAVFSIFLGEGLAIFLKNLSNTLA